VWEIRRGKRRRPTHNSDRSRSGRDHSDHQCTPFGALPHAWGPSAPGRTAHACANGRDNLTAYYRASTPTQPCEHRYTESQGMERARLGRPAHRECRELPCRHCAPHPSLVRRALNCRRRRRLRRRASPTRRRRRRRTGWSPTDVWPQSPPPRPPPEARHWRPACCCPCAAAEARCHSP